MTRKGIETDLEISPYTVELNDLKFFFSSLYYKTKFLQKYAANRNAISENLQDKFNFFITADNLADIVLYSKIEKRGFLLEYEGEKICQKNLKLDGVIATLKVFKMQ